MNLNDEYRKVFEEEVPQRIERRQKPDKIIKMMKVFSLTGWALIVAGLFMTYFAPSQSATILDIYRSKEIRDYWQPQYLFYAIYLLIPGFFSSGVSLALNTRRLKRKNDKISLATVAAIIVSLTAIVIIVIMIATMGFS